MLSTDSLPRKWSIRKTCDSSKTWWIVSLRARATLEVGAEGLLDQNLGVLGKSGRAEHRDHRAEGGGRDGEVEEPPRLGVELPLGGCDGLLERSGALGIRGAEGELRLEALPGLARRLRGPELRHGLSRVRPELLGAEREGRG